MSRRADIVIGAGLLAFGLALLLWLIPHFVGVGDQAILPKFVAGSLSVLAASLIAARWLQPVRPNAVESDPFIETGGGEPLVIAMLAAIWCGFLLATNLLGFYLGGGLALAASFIVLGIRRPVSAAAWIAGTLIVVYLVFERLMSLTLPRGAVIAWLGT
jgi:hypothetical protein